MPGMIVFRRRWSVGSDDLVVPTIFLIFLHSTWLAVLFIVLGVVDFETTPVDDCTEDLRDLIVGHIVILAVCTVLEILLALVSTRGSILTQAPRASIEYILYIRIAVGLVELAWLIVGAVWASKHYPSCSPDPAKRALLGVMVCNWLMILAFFIALWCTFDTAGRKWVKMKRYQDSMKERRQERRRGGPNRRQSGSRRNWRQRSKIVQAFFLRRMQRKAFRAYEESWDRRLQLLCCCVERKGRNRNSMSEIAALFTDFFRDLDVVPSDVVAGLVLLRRYQQQRMNCIISQGSNDVYQYLSGVPVSPQTQFLQLTQPAVLEEYKKTIHFMRFALAAYGWPAYVMMHPCTWLCRLTPLLRCCCCRSTTHTNLNEIDDNCCLSNYGTAKRISGLHNVDLVYVTYHVDIGETPFFVALDHAQKKVVIAIRGTLSLQDVLTDLKAEPETLPLNPPRDDWQGHKGMVQAAVYIKKKLINDGILQSAWERDEANTNSTDLLQSEKETSKYELVLVGHSLGAGTAAILAILLKDSYPDLQCYAFSPPGGLLTLPCVEATKSFITSVVVGKDCVPRIGLPQLEMLRADILNHIKNTSESKWKIISKGLMCCGNKLKNDAVDMQERDVTAHPSNSAIGLSAHAPLYPPGNMIHVVRSRFKNKGGVCKSDEPIYQALWANNGDFDEVLVSPTMINDHMPDNVLDALERVVMKVAPEKPSHILTEEQRREMLNHPSMSSLATPCMSETSPVDPNLTNPGGLTFTSAPFQNRCAVDERGEPLYPITDAMGEGNGFFFNYENTASPQEVVRAPLASPETLSMASGVSVINPTSNISTRDSLRHSLQQCSNKNMKSHTEVTENVASDKDHNFTTPNTSDLLRENSGRRKVSPENVEAGNPDEQDGEDYFVRLRSGNTISIKAEVINEMIKSGSQERSPPKQRANQTSPLEQNQDSESVPKAPTSAPLSASLPPNADGDRNPTVTTHKDANSVGKGDEVTAEINTAPQEPGDKNDKVNGAVDFFCHAPVGSNQLEHGHPNTYYSQGGIGYPHNAMHLPSRNSSLVNHTPYRHSKSLDDSVNNEGESTKESNVKDENQYSLPTDEISIQRTSDLKGVVGINNNLTLMDSGNVSQPSAKNKPKPFVHAESETNLLTFKRLLPGMRRSAEQGDIVHLCDQLEVFEKEEDLAKLSQSSLVLSEEDETDPIAKPAFSHSDAPQCRDNSVESSVTGNPSNISNFSLGNAHENSPEVCVKDSSNSLPSGVLNLVSDVPNIDNCTLHETHL